MLEPNRDVPAISARSSLPQSPALNAVLSVFDAMDATVLICDRESHIRFFNISYYLAHKEAFIKKHITPEMLLGYRLLDFDEISPDNRRAIERCIKGEAIHKYMHRELDRPESWLSDIVPIESDGFSGFVNIEYESQIVGDLSRQLSYYKNKAKLLQKELLAKDTLPPYFQQIIGYSPALVKALRIGAQVAPTMSSVCITGESGTGKEVFAEAIHYSSNNTEGPLIKVNCAAIPESLMESELFGYEKGAFTGANANGNPGKFELANGGTLFLDEIGDMPLSMQAKLLRVLQEKEVTRLGGRKPIKLSFRLITATNRDLEQMVRDGAFREDLYYRICIIPLHLPPLRERREDISELAQRFLSSLDMPQWVDRSFSEEVLARFRDYHWPGNIRELRNCVERMAILSPDACIDAEYLPSAIAEAAVFVPSADGNTPIDYTQYNLKDILSKAECDAFRSVLSMTNGNKARAIEILGLSKRAFYLKLDKYGLR